MALNKYSVQTLLFLKFMVDHFAGCQLLFLTRCQSFFWGEPIDCSYINTGGISFRDMALNEYSVQALIFLKFMINHFASCQCNACEAYCWTYKNEYNCRVCTDDKWVSWKNLNCLRSLLYFIFMRYFILW